MEPIPLHSGFSKWNPHPCTQGSVSGTQSAADHGADFSAFIVILVLACCFYSNFSMLLRLMKKQRLPVVDSPVIVRQMSSSLLGKVSKLKTQVPDAK